MIDHSLGRHFVLFVHWCGWNLLSGYRNIYFTEPSHICDGLHRTSTDCSNPHLLMWIIFISLRIVVMFLGLHLYFFMIRLIPWSMLIPLCMYLPHWRERPIRALHAAVPWLTIPLHVLLPSNPWMHQSFAPLIPQSINPLIILWIHVWIVTTVCVMRALPPSSLLSHPVRCRLIH